MSIDEWFKEFGKNTTSYLELIKYWKKLKIHNLVICMRDELTNVYKHTKNIIMNLEDNNGNGSHWVCIFNCQDKYYFDSFGFHHLLKKYNSCRMVFIKHFKSNN